MGLAFIPFYVRYLGLEGYGLVGLFASLQIWLTILDLGMTPTLGREMARLTGGGHTAHSIRTLLRSIEVIALILALISALGIWLASNWLASSWLQAETLQPRAVSVSIGLIGVVIAIRFLESLYRSAVVGLQRQVAYNVISAGMATIRAAGAAVVLAWVSPSVIVFFIWQMVISALTLIFLVALTYKSLPRTNARVAPSLEALKPVCKFAGGMIVTTLLATLLTQVDKVLLSRLLTLSEFGAYTLATTLSGALMLLVKPITQAFYPRLCAQVTAGNSEFFSATYHTAVQLVTVVVGSASVILVLFSELIVFSWVGNAELAEDVSPVVSVLALGNMLNAFMYMPHFAQLAHGWTALVMRVNFLAVLVIVPSIFFVVPVHGAFGAAWVWALLNLGYVFIVLPIMHRHILVTEMWAWFWLDVGRPLVVILAINSLAKFLVASLALGALASLFVVAFFWFLSMLVAILSARRLDFASKYILRVLRG